MKRILLNIIAFYQKTISPDHGVLGRAVFGGACRFEPTCSEYTRRAIEVQGAWGGVFLGVKRVIRCHPFAKGGLDPVPSPAVKEEREAVEL
ncbi:MAG: membrane protein insertion efficiency factor YidD [Patescibacteria group bacterium]|nr:MAG: membrane protein insertion efficiency factor YidD [Patescibacteria group bacterium]